MLHGWITNSLQRVRRAGEGVQYHTDINPLLPATADTFFSFHSKADPSTTTTLQRTLNAKATLSQTQAAVERMKEQSKRGDKWEWAHHKAITAKGAWSWKVTQPEGPFLRLADAEYTIAARLNLGLSPFPARTAAALPEHCPLCTHTQTGAPMLLSDDPWHWLTCASLTRGELTRRHDAVVNAIARVAWLVGAQVQTEVQGLDPHSTMRPDLQLVFPGRMLLVDVVVAHSLTSSRVARGQSAATTKQTEKHTKYARVASRLEAELLNLSVDTCGGMASHAVKLVEAIGEEGERWSAGTWSSGHIKRMLLGSIAVALQRGNAMVMLRHHLLMLHMPHPPYRHSPTATPSLTAIHLSAQLSLGQRVDRGAADGRRGTAWCHLWNIRLLNHPVDSRPALPELTCTPSPLQPRACAAISSLAHLTA